jgi:hypothetical protein
MANYALLILHCGYIHNLSYLITLELKTSSKCWYKIVEGRRGWERETSVLEVFIAIFVT